MEIFISAVLTLSVSLIIAWATAHWTVKKSLKQFYSKKLWEKKLTLYSEIMDGIAHLHAEYVNLKYLLLEFVDNRLEDKKFREKLKKIRRSLEIFQMQGSIIINPKIMPIIGNIRKSIAIYDNRVRDHKAWFRDAETIGCVEAIINNCTEGQEKIQKIAKEELHI